MGKVVNAKQALLQLQQLLPVLLKHFVLQILPLQVAMQQSTAPYNEQVSQLKQGLADRTAKTAVSVAI